MPKEYTAIRDNLIKQGKDPKEAKRIAAATYNSRHPSSPVTRKSDKRKSGKKMAMKRDMDMDEM